MNRFLVLGVAALLCETFSTVARGQDSVLTELYGAGVHAYHSGNLSEALELFTSAIEQGNRDPRCFYYRGLTLHRSGRSAIGDADFRLGAELEANSGESYQVSRALERVQGRQRIQIEKQRQQARLAMRSKQNQANQANFQQMQRSGQSTNRKSAPAQGTGGPTTPSEPDKTDPFVDDVKPEKAPEKPATVAAEPKPEESDPFGAATPATTPPTATTEKPAEAASDPFAPAATPPAKDDASDPFSNEKNAEAPPATEKPAEKPAEKAAEDPFGM